MSSGMRGQLWPATYANAPHQRSASTRPTVSHFVVWLISVPGSATRSRRVTSATVRPIVGVLPLSRGGQVPAHRVSRTTIGTGAVRSWRARASVAGGCSLGVPFAAYRDAVGILRSCRRLALRPLRICSAVKQLEAEIHFRDYAELAEPGDAHFGAGRALCTGLIACQRCPGVRPLRRGRRCGRRASAATGALLLKSPGGRCCDENRKRASGKDVSLRHDVPLLGTRTVPTPSQMPMLLPGRKRESTSTAEV